MSPEIPQWLIPALTMLMGAVGGYFGASRKVVVLETYLEGLLKWKEETHLQVHAHNEDLLIHDIEIQTLCAKTGVPRARRQVFREE